MSNRTYEIVSQLYGTKSNDQIAKALTREGIRTPRGLKFNGKLISDFVYKNKIGKTEVAAAEVVEKPVKSALPSWFYNFIEDSRIPADLKLTVVQQFL